jgi:amino acid transporter
MNTIKRSLGVVAVTMINIIAVDSLRTLPFSAAYGTHLIFYYALAALLFFLPVSLAAAELATGWPCKGGIYVWMRQAFGERWGFWIIWLQWLYNIVWYPTALSFVAGALAYLIDPPLADSPRYMIGMVLGLFWGATLLNLLGMRIASWFSTFTAVLGTLVPMLIIIALAGVWLWEGRVSHLNWHAHSVIPQQLDWHHMVFVVAILFGLMGMEMSASHADEVIAPHRTFPRAITYSSAVILSTLVLASLAIATVVPQQQLNIVTGLIQAFHLFLIGYHFNWVEPIMIACMVLGGLGGVAAWIIGPTKGLLVAACDGVAPAFFAKTNAQGMPTHILFTQAIILSLLTCVYWLMPSVKSAYWLLTAMTAQIAFVVYIGLFMAWRRLQQHTPQHQPTFRVPGGKALRTCLIWLGTGTCAGAIVLGFMPPAQISVGSTLWYEAILFAGLSCICLAPLAMFARKRTK